MCLFHFVTPFLKRFLGVNVISVFFVVFLLRKCVFLNSTTQCENRWFVLHPDGSNITDIPSL